jgi:hypothetical protein
MKRNQSAPRAAAPAKPTPPAPVVDPAPVVPPVATDPPAPAADPAPVVDPAVPIAAAVDPVDPVDPAADPQPPAVDDQAHPAEEEEQVKVELLVSMAGAEARSVGYIHTCGVSEAQRLYDAGYAKPHNA